MNNELSPAGAPQERLPTALMLIKQEREFGDGVVMRGTVGRHEVQIIADKNSFSGSLNKVSLSRDQAQAIFEKYEGVAVKEPRLLEEQRQQEMLTAALTEIL